MYVTENGVTMGQKINIVQRKTAAGIVMAMFGVCGQVAFALEQIAMINSSLNDAACGRGLTPNEREFISAMAKDFRKKAQTLRKLSHRLRGVDNAASR